MPAVADELEEEELCQVLQVHPAVSEWWDWYGAMTQNCDNFDEDDCTADFLLEESQYENNEARQNHDRKKCRGWVYYFILQLVFFHRAARFHLSYVRLSLLEVIFHHLVVKYDFLEYLHEQVQSGGSLYFHPEQFFFLLLSLFIYDTFP